MNTENRTEDEIVLYIPEVSELGYRQKIMADPATMSYNKGYDLSFDGYDPDTGCIAFEKEEWSNWHSHWIHAEPERFYAYVRRVSDSALIGEVCLHHHGNDDFHEMGIVIEDRYRGSGYGEMALRLLLHHAFDEMHVNAVHNSFERERTAAYRLHIRCGFRDVSQDINMREVLITKQDRLKKRVSEMEVRKLTASDAEEVLSLYLGNPQYFHYCPPFPDINSVICDITCAVPGYEEKKEFCGYFEDGRLCAVLDLLYEYPDKDSVWAGLFMMREDLSNRGIGSEMIRQLCEKLSGSFRVVRLGYVKNNPQAESFWKKCGFISEGKTVHQNKYDIELMYKQF